MSGNAVRGSLVVFSVISLVVACGSVSPPIGTSGGAGSSATGSAGTTGAAGTKGGGGTTGVAGTGGVAGTMGGAGTTGAAGPNGGAGTTGAAGTGGRVPLKHRAAATTCSPSRLPGACAAAANPSTPPAALLCKQDADCGAGKNGRCLPMARVVGCVCSYDGCSADSDCMAGPCECRAAAAAADAVPGYSAANVCKGGNCRVDKDCTNGYCSPSLGSCGNFGGVVGYYCHTPKDLCVDDADCGTQGGGDCRYNQVMGLWKCESSQCAG
jgi:hypothetical protein